MQVVAFRNLIITGRVSPARHRDLADLATRADRPDRHRDLRRATRAQRALVPVLLPHAESGARARRCGGADGGDLRDDPAVRTNRSHRGRDAGSVCMLDVPRDRHQSLDRSSQLTCRRETAS